MIKTTRLLVLLGCAILVGACSLPRGAALQSEIVKEADADEPSIDVVPVTRANLKAIAKWPDSHHYGAYHWIGYARGTSSNIIKPGDVVDLMIWDNQENSLLTSLGQKSVVMEGLRVSPGGSIFVPYVENVRIAGLSPAAARARVQNELEVIVPSAQVQLSLQQGTHNSVDLVSGVARPGTYPLPGRDYTILSLISAGGGISTSMRSPVVRLIRGGQSYQVRANDLFADGKLNTTLRGGDKVVVEEDQRSFTAVGASGREDLIYFPKDYLTAMEAVALMGGLSDSRANPEGVLVLREYSPYDVRLDGSGPSRAQVVFTMDLTTADGLFAARKFQIRPQDTVMATESPVTAAQTVFGLIGSVVGLASRL